MHLFQTFSEQFRVNLDFFLSANFNHCPMVRMLPDAERAEKFIVLSAIELNIFVFMLMTED